MLHFKYSSDLALSAAACLLCPGLWFSDTERCTDTPTNTRNKSLWEFQSVSINPIFLMLYLM